MRKWYVLLAFGCFTAQFCKAGIFAGSRRNMWRRYVSSDSVPR
jgi:hypothetical protein